MPTSSDTYPHFECQNYEEVAGPDDIYRLTGNNPDWFFQLKFDGIWAEVHIENGQARIYSKTGLLKETLVVPEQSYLPITSRGLTVLTAEFMQGTQWSQHPDRAGKLFVFDCVVDAGIDISALPYKTRFSRAIEHGSNLGHYFTPVPSYSISRLGQLWTSLADTHEGFVIRRWSGLRSDPLYKLKFSVEDDFIITGSIEGKGKHVGRLGAWVLSQIDPVTTKIVHVMDCGGGFTDAQRDFFWSHRNETFGKVALIGGKGRFNDGALRYPEFIRLRDDKHARDCILKRQSK